VTACYQAVLTVVEKSKSRVRLDKVRGCRDGLEEWRWRFRLGVELEKQASPTSAISPSRVRAYSLIFFST
jgi:3'-phosphoadenosine 5'-phosphosulfate sulfotransferase